jgi:hypothetical protein
MARTRALKSGAHPPYPFLPGSGGVLPPGGDRAVIIVQQVAAMLGRIAIKPASMLLLSGKSLKIQAFPPRCGAAPGITVL